MTDPKRKTKAQLRSENSKLRTLVRKLYNHAIEQHNLIERQADTHRQELDKILAATEEKLGEEIVKIDV